MSHHKGLQRCVPIRSDSSLPDRQVVCERRVSGWRSPSRTHGISFSSSRAPCCGPTGLRRLGVGRVRSGRRRIQPGDSELALEEQRLLIGLALLPAATILSVLLTPGRPTIGAARCSPLVL